MDTWCVGLFSPGVPELTREVGRLGSTAARLKLKGIDGGPHKRRSMRINSMQREEPYLDLTCGENCQRWQVRKGPTQVVHGCRQLVS